MFLKMWNEERAHNIAVTRSEWEWQNIAQIVEMK